ncbi:MAG: D-glycero-beta-D-manno-heptose 1,7-bisphosphate 7-phosphatase [Gammaproteobacteria bacterium]|jgi:D-glycero-D-manno-heptose 1,7-bisphosphate phosphatase
MQLVILDRDGVINELREYGINSPSGWKPIRGSLEAIARLHHAGWRVVVVMNQPALAGGQPDLETLVRINTAMLRRVTESGGVIDAVFFCPHGPEAGCQCRKPQPGLLLDIASRLRIPLDDVPVIGDSLNDIRAARSAGARPLLVKTGKGFGTVGTPQLDHDVPVYDDLYSAVDDLLGHTHH